MILSSIESKDLSYFALSELLSVSTQIFWNGFIFVEKIVSFYIYFSIILKDLKKLKRDNERFRLANEGEGVVNLFCSSGMTFDTLFLDLEEVLSFLVLTIYSVVVLNNGTMVGFTVDFVVGFISFANISKKYYNH